MKRLPSRPFGARVINLKGICHETADSSNAGRAADGAFRAAARAVYAGAGAAFQRDDGAAAVGLYLQDQREEQVAAVARLGVGIDDRRDRVLARVADRADRQSVVFIGVIRRIDFGVGHRKHFFSFF